MHFQKQLQIQKEYGKLEVNEEEAVDIRTIFDAALIRRTIQNPVYCGKISYGRRRTEKVHGMRNEYRQVKKDGSN